MKIVGHGDQWANRAHYPISLPLRSRVSYIFRGNMHYEDLYQKTHKLM